MAVKDKQVWLGNVPGGMDEASVLDYIAQLLPNDRTAPFKAFLRRSQGSSMRQYAIIHFRHVDDAAWFKMRASFVWPDGMYAVVRPTSHMFICHAHQNAKGGGGNLKVEVLVVLAMVASINVI